MIGKMSRFAFLFIFFVVGIQGVYAQSGAIIKAQGKIEDAQKMLENGPKYLEKVRNENKWINTVISGGKIDIPCSIPFEKNITGNKPSDEKFQMILDDVTIKPSGTRATVLVRIKQSTFSAGAEGYIYFAAESDFTKSGGFVGETNLYLLEDVEIALGSGIKLKIKSIDPTTKEFTSIAFDCKGFKNLHLNAELNLDNTIAVKEDKDGKRTNMGVTIPIVTDVEDLNAWLLTINNIPKFQFTKIPDFTVSINTLVYDNHLEDNSDLMPTQMGNTTITGMWTGFYCAGAELAFPKYLRDDAKPSSERTTVALSQLFIDNSGITANLTTATTILNGSIGKWKYSIDNLSLAIVGSNFDGAGFGFGGKMDVPIAKEDKKMGYSASYIDSKLTFKVSDIENDLTFNFLNVAKVEFPDKNGKPSVVNLEVVASDDQLKGSITFTNVSLSIDAKKGSTSPNENSASLLKVTVENLKFSTVQEPSYVSFDGATIESGLLGSKLAGLPISITKVDMQASDNKISMTFGLQLVLMSGAIEGTADVTVNAKNDDGSRWMFGGIGLGQICVKAEKSGAYYIKGCVTVFDQDDTYGNGFSGTLTAKFVNKFELEATALFGKTLDKTDGEGTTSGFEYFYVDAAIKFPIPIPIFTGVGINGFTGGIYQKVTSSVGSTGSTCTGPGCTAKGKKYTPSATTGLGVKAGLAIVSMPTPQAFSGDLVFGIEFTDEESVKKITFDGTVKVINLSPPEATDEVKKPEDIKACDPGLILKWETEFVLASKSEGAHLSGNFDLYVNYLDELIRGSLDGCKAGRTEIYFSESKWFVYVGKPATPNSIKLVDLLTVKSYFFMGNVLPNPIVAPMPDKFGGSVTPVDPSLLNAGLAFGIGARVEANWGRDFTAKVGFRIGEGDLSVGYSCSTGIGVSVGFGAGMDLVLVKDKIPVICDGKERGINNWYATGQAYLYADFAVNFFAECEYFGSTKFDLLGVQIHANVFAQAPNPVYLKGAVGAKATFFGLSAKFKVDFEYEKDKTCNNKIEMNRISVIDRIYPSHITHTIGAYDAVRVTLKEPLGTRISVPQGSTVVQTLTLTSMVFTGDNTQIAANFLAPANSGYDYSFVSKKALKAGKYTATFAVNYTGGVPEETREVEFTVTEESATIPVSNVSYSYPMPEMKNFYPVTGKRGYIKLTKIPVRPVETLPGRAFAIKIYEGESLVSSEKVIYNGDESNYGTSHQFEFNIPSASKFKKFTKYTLKLVKTRDFNLANTKPESSGFGSTTNDVSDPKDVEVLKFDFTTSKYNSFEEKMGAMVFEEPSDANPNSFSVPLKYNSTKTASFNNLENEKFEDIEIKGYSGGNVRVEPLIRVAYQPTLFNKSNACPSTIPISKELNLKELSDVYQIDFAPTIATIKQYACSPSGGIIVKKESTTLSVGYYLPGKTVPESIVYMPVSTPEIR